MPAGHRRLQPLHHLPPAVARPGAGRAARRQARAVAAGSGRAGVVAVQLRGKRGYEDLDTRGRVRRRARAPGGRGGAPARRSRLREQGPPPQRLPRPRPLRRPAPPRSVDLFPPEQVHVLVAEDLFAVAAGAPTTQLTDFLGLPRAPLTDPRAFKANVYEPMPDDVRARLAGYYAERNEELVRAARPPRRLDHRLTPSASARRDEAKRRSEPAHARRAPQRAAAQCASRSARPSADPHGADEARDVGAVGPSPPRVASMRRAGGRRRACRRGSTTVTSGPAAGLSGRRRLQTRRLGTGRAAPDHGPRRRRCR